MNIRGIMGVVLALCTASCDEGDIYPTGGENGVEGREVRISGELKGLERVPRGFSVVLAGFGKESDYATIQKSVVDEKLDGFSLSGIPEGGERVELCLVNAIRRRIVSLYTVEMGGRSSVSEEIGTVDVSGDGVMQRCVFNVSCTACHGGSNSAAAGLWLTDGKAVESVVGVASTRDSMGRMIVSEGSADESFMWLMLTGSEGVESLRYNHSNIIEDRGVLEYVRGWIEGR